MNKIITHMIYDKNKNTEQVQPSILEVYKKVQEWIIEEDDERILRGIQEDIRSEKKEVEKLEQMLFLLDIMCDKKIDMLDRRKELEQLFKNDEE